MNDRKHVYFRCDDNGEMLVFTKYLDDNDYSIDIEDSYCNGDYKGIIGRFRRAWHAFWAKPVCYTGVFCQDEKRVKKFLNDCLDIVNGNAHMSDDRVRMIALNAIMAWKDENVYEYGTIEWKEYVMEELGITEAEYDELTSE